MEGTVRGHLGQDTRGTTPAGLSQSHVSIGAQLVSARTHGRDIQGFFGLTGGKRRQCDKSRGKDGYSEIGIPEPIHEGRMPGLAHQVIVGCV